MELVLECHLGGVNLADAPELQIWVDGSIHPRHDARVSVFDAGFQSGDAVWEGLRVYNGTVFRLNEHLDRLRASANAVGIKLPLSLDALGQAIYATIASNVGFGDGVHIRLIISRGVRSTSGMDPRNASHPTTVIIPERKPVLASPSPQRLRTASTRRPAPQVLDATIHHANQLNTILARLEALSAGADAALMLDERGFVAEADTANIMVLHRGCLLTPSPRACVHGITRGVVLDLARNFHIPVEEREVSLFEVYSADEVFLTGTVCELVPIVEVDSRIIGSGHPGSEWEKLLAAYRNVVESETRAPALA